MNEIQATMNSAIIHISKAVNLELEFSEKGKTCYANYAGYIDAVAQSGAIEFSHEFANREVVILKSTYAVVSRNNLNLDTLYKINGFNNNPINGMLERQFFTDEIDGANVLAFQKIDRILMLGKDGLLKFAEAVKNFYETIIGNEEIESIFKSFKQ